MTRSQFMAGCAVVIGTVAGGLISSAAVDGNIPANRHAEPAARSPAPDAGQANCVTLGGEHFGWRFPNVPFGARICSR